jgi:hypothetical protein
MTRLQNLQDRDAVSLKLSDRQSVAGSGEIGGYRIRNETLNGSAGARRAVGLRVKR